MTGLPNNNLEAFNKHAAYWRSLGFNIKNPAEFPDTGKHTYAEWLKRDLHILMNECNALMVMPGWEKSKGATTEKKVAESLGYPILESGVLQVTEGEVVVDFVKEEVELPNDILVKADSIVTCDRQKQYGDPFRDFSRTTAILNSLGFRVLDNAGQVIPLGPQHHPILMIAVKLSRIMNNNGYHYDSLLDCAGYVKTAEFVNNKIIASK